jgi:hypothetical protein
LARLNFDFPANPLAGLLAGTKANFSDLFFSTHDASLLSYHSACLHTCDYSTVTNGKFFPQNGALAVMTMIGTTEAQVGL